MAFSNVIDLFRDLPTDQTIQSVGYEYILPETPITRDTTRFEFRIADNSDNFWDITQSMYKLTFNVEKGDGTLFQTGANAVPLNNIGQTIWKNHYFEVNHHKIGFTPDLQHIRAYWENLLGHTIEKKKHDLFREFWFPDQAGRFQQTRLASADSSAAAQKRFNKDSKNQGLNQRAHYTDQGEEVTLYCRFHNDLFMQSKFLPARTSFTLIFEKADPKFYMMADSTEATAKAMINIKRMELVMCRIKLFDNVLAEFERRLQSQPIQYPLYVTDMIYFEVPKNASTFQERNIFRGINLPKTVLIGIIPTNNLLGGYDKNPLELANNGLTDIGFFVNSIPVPLRPIEVDYKRFNVSGLLNQRHAEQAYLSLQTELNQINSDISCGITYEDYLAGYMLYAFSLSRTGNKQTIEGIRAAKNEGIVDLHIKFEKPLLENMRVVIMTKTNGVFLIDKLKQIELKQ